MNLQTRNSPDLLKSICDIETPYFRLSLCSSTGDYWCEHPDEYPEEVVSRILGRLRERREREHHEHDVMVAAMGQESPQPRSGIAASTADGMEPLVIPERSKKMLPNMMMPDIVATFFAPVQGKEVRHYLRLPAISTTVYMTLDTPKIIYRMAEEAS